MVNNDFEAKVADIFRLINQNRADYQAGIQTASQHAQELVDALYERLKGQLKVRFAELESRIKSLEERRGKP